jgi:protease-4
LGEQGKQNGLVDEYGGLDKAIEIAKQLSGIPADKGVRRVIFPAPRTFFEQIFSFEPDEDSQIKLRQQRAAYETLPKEVKRTLRYAAMMDEMRNGKIMALMPFELTIK